MPEVGFQKRNSWQAGCCVLFLPSPKPVCITGIIVHLWSLVPVLIYFKKVNSLEIIKKKKSRWGKISCCEKAVVCCIEIIENGFLNSPKKFIYGLKDPNFLLKKKKKDRKCKFGKYFKISLSSFFAPGGGSEKFRKHHM